MRWIEWFAEHELVTWWMFVLSLILFLGSVVAMPLVLARMRADYFVHRDPPDTSWIGRHGLVRVVVLICKNLLGAVLVLAGLAMLVLPGQGLLTILVGVSLLDFPGKRRLELRIVERPRVLAAINWIRARAGSAPLILPSADP